MTAEDFKKYAVDIFGGKQVKFEDWAPNIFKIKAATKKFQVQKQNYNACQQALFERLKPIPLTKTITRLTGF